MTRAVGRLSAARAPRMICLALVAIAAIALATLPCDPAAAFGDRVTAEHGVAAGGDINARDIVLKYGLTEEEVRTLVRELHEQEGPLADKLAEFAEKLGVTQSAVRNFFRILGAEQVPPERLVEALAEIAERHKRLLEQAEAPASDDPAVEALREQATAAIAAGDYDRAESLLAAAEEADLAAVRRAQEVARQAQEFARRAQEVADQRLLDAAATRARRGELSRTQLDYRTAAGHFEAAAELVPPGQTDTHATYLRLQADALSDHGLWKGDNAALVEAIEIYRRALAETPRERAPLDWATTQNNLGAALQALGAREAGTARLEQAVAAYRAALEERTRERAPLDWAQTQNNLGNALQALGERHGRPDLFHDALAAVEAAFEVDMAAGLTHYERYYRDRIEELEGLIERAERTERAG